MAQPLGRTAALLLAAAALAFAPLPAVAQDGAKKPPAAKPNPDVDPVLTPEEQKKHDLEVKKLVAELKAQRNKDMMQSRIEQIGAGGGRVARDALMAFAKGNSNHEFVATTFKALSGFKGKTVLEYLCAPDALKAYNNFLVQIAAADALGEMKDPRAADPLIEVAKHPKTKIEVASACCHAMVKADPKSSKVAECLMTHSAAKDDTLRANAVESLGGLKSEEAYKRLLEVLEKDGNTRVRGAACTGLKDLGRKDALPALQKAAKGDKSDTVRTLAMEAIKALGGVAGK